MFDSAHVPADDTGRRVVIGMLTDLHTLSRRLGWVSFYGYLQHGDMRHCAPGTLAGGVGRQFC